MARRNFHVLSLSISGLEILMSDTSYLLTRSCPNQPGIVARVTAELFSHGGNILEAHQFDDTETWRFFTRIVFNLYDDREIPKLVAGFKPIGDYCRMIWEIRPRNERRKVLLLVSKLDHCLVDLLYRWRIRELRMDVVGIISNHPRETYNGTDFGLIPFHYLSITKEAKPQQEAQIKAIVTQTGADLVVIARFSACPRKNRYLIERPSGAYTNSSTDNWSERLESHSAKSILRNAETRVSAPWFIDDRICKRLRQAA